MGKRAGLRPELIVLIVGAIGIAIVYVAWSFWTAVVGASRPAERPLASSESECDEIATARVVDAAAASGLVENAAIRDGGLVLVMRRRAFEAMTHRDQARLVVAYDCQIAGDGHHLTRIRIRSSLNGADMAVFESPDLLRLRPEHQ